MSDSYPYERQTSSGEIDPANILRDLDVRLADVERRHRRLGATAWMPLTLEPNWSNYGGGYSHAAIRKVGGLVEIRGLVTCSAPVVRESTNSLITVVPSEFALNASVLLGIQMYSSDLALINGTRNRAMRVNFTSLGELIVACDLTSTNWVNLSDIAPYSVDEDAPA